MQIREKLKNPELEKYFQEDLKIMNENEDLKMLH